MALLKERKTPAENIAFMGISAGIVVAFGLLSTFLPLSSFLVILFLPLVCALTAFYCQDRYLIGYVAATIVVSLLTTVYDISVTLFDVVPAILTGTLFGFLLKKKISSSLTILIVSLLKLGLNYLMLLLLKGIYGVDIIESFLTLLGLENKEHIREIVPAFIFGYALIQESISFFVIIFGSNSLEAMATKKVSPFVFAILSLAGIACSIGFSFISYAVAYLFGALSIYLSFASSSSLFRKNPWWVYLGLGLLLALSFYLSAYFYSSLPKQRAPLLFLSFFASISLCSGFSSLLFKNEKGVKE